MKCCIKCDIEKDDGDFLSERNICKICRREQQKQYRQNNREAIKERDKKYCQNNAEAIKERNKQYRQNNAEAIKEFQKQYRQNNAEVLKEKRKQYYQNNAEAIKERNKQYYQNNPEAIKQYRQNNLHKEMLRGARMRAKEKNISFNLNEEDINIPNVCPVLGIPLEAGIGKGFVQSNSPTLDRIIPEKGYVKGNIIVVSSRANTIKNNATPEEIIAVGEFYKKLLEEAKKNE